MCETMKELGVAIDGGKDSLSMAAGKFFYDLLFNHFKKLITIYQFSCKKR